MAEYDPIDMGDSWPQTSMAGPTESGGFWSGLGDVAKSVWGSTGTKDTSGSGIAGFFGGLGDLAKVAAPAVGLGTGIMGLINQNKALEEASKARKQQQEAQALQLSGAKQAQELAPQMAGMAPEIADVARKLDPIAERVSSVGPKIDAAAGNVRTGIVAPVLEFAADRLKRAQAGEIPPAIEAQITNWTQGAKAKALDYLARSGQADSSARVQMEEYIDKQAQAMRAQYLQEEESQALAAFDQARTGEVSAASMYGQEGATEATAGSLYGTEGAGLGRAADVIAGAGNLLTGSSAAAGNSARVNQDELNQLLAMIAAANKSMAQLSGGAA